MSTSVIEAASTSNKKVWTDAAFMSLPDDACHYEIVDGELVVMGNSGALHGYISIVLSSALFTEISNIN